MDHVEQRYAPRGGAVLAAWLTALAAPAVLGWAFWSASAHPTSIAPAQQPLVASADPWGVEQVAYHR